tara:strand:- start:616 stop:1035 length:420 start_codon:yes stop_codon:yes gene_type:complete
MKGTILIGLIFMLLGLIPVLTILNQTQQAFYKHSKYYFNWMKCYYTGVSAVQYGFQVRDSLPEINMDRTDTLQIRVRDHGRYLPFLSDETISIFVFKWDETIYSACLKDTSKLVVYYSDIIVSEKETLITRVKVLESNH